jgi:ABC-type sugar transport system permease subunit
MLDALMEFLNTAVWPGVVVAVQLVIGALVVYLMLRLVRALPPAGRWKLVKLALTILFLPFVLVWKFMTAGSDCGCCCDEDD